MASPIHYRTYRVNARDREPLLRWMEAALRAIGCRVIRATPPTEAPFRITFELPSGERRGIVAYAFLANTQPTGGRPQDEHRFQIKYGSSFHEDHELWHDEFGLYTTLLLGINPGANFFVAADPWLHRITRFSKSVEFKDDHVDQIQRAGWYPWERERRPGKRRASDDIGPLEVLVGGTAEHFLRYIEFEREALAEDQGHRQLLAERAMNPRQLSAPLVEDPAVAAPAPTRLHALADEFELTPAEVLDLIASAPRLKMAVRGWVAEEHLVRALRQLPGVSEAQRLAIEGGADVSLRYEGSRPLTIECKNTLRKRDRRGHPRLDFQRTRASQNDPCSRYYGADDFDVVAACLHAVNERWEYSFVEPQALEPHPRCPGKLAHLVHVDERWSQDPAQILRAAAARPA